MSPIENNDIPVRNCHLILILCEYDIGVPVIISVNACSNSLSRFQFFRRAKTNFKMESDKH